MGEFNTEIRSRDFLILSPYEISSVLNLKNRQDNHDTKRELFLAKSVYRDLQRLKKTGVSHGELERYLIDRYSIFYAFERIGDGEINYQAVIDNIGNFISEIVSYFEGLIQTDVPLEYKYAAELREEVKRNIVQIIELAGSGGQAKVGSYGRPSGSYQARLVLSKLIDWLHVNYKESVSVEEELGSLEEFLNRCFFLPNDNNSGMSKIGDMEIIRFYDIDQFMATVRYAVLSEEENPRWICYDQKGTRLKDSQGEDVTVERLRDEFRGQKNIFEERTSRGVRYFPNPRTGYQERVYFHPRTKETPSISAKMDRQGTRDSDEIHDQKGIALTVPSANQVHVCEKALDKVWDIPGIRTDYTDTFHKPEKTVNIFSAPGMHIVKKRLLHPYKCEVIIDTLARNMDANESVGLVNHGVYRYIQNMVKGVYQRITPHIIFDQEEIRRWVRYKVLNLTPINARTDVIEERYGGDAKMRELRKKTEDLVYDRIIELLPASNE